MRFSINGLFKVADKAVNFAIKHSPAMLGVAAIGCGVAAVVMAGKETNAAEEGLSDLEERHEAWAKYKEYKKEYQHDCEVAAAIGEDVSALTVPMEPEYEKVTVLELGKFLVKSYPKTLLFTILSLGSGIGMFCIFRNRVATLTAEVALLRARDKLLEENIKREYGDEGYERVTSPVYVAEKAQGRKEAVTEVDERSEDIDSRYYNGVWMHQCGWFAKDDFEYSLAELRERNDECYDWFRRHTFLSQRKLFEILEMPVTGSRSLGWEEGDWCGLSFEAGCDPHYDERFNHREFYEAGTNTNFRSAYIRFPKMSPESTFVRM